MYGDQFGEFLTIILTTYGNKDVDSFQDVYLLKSASWD